MLRRLLKANTQARSRPHHERLQFHPFLLTLCFHHCLICRTSSVDKMNDVYIFRILSLNVSFVSILTFYCNEKVHQQHSVYRFLFIF
eukprot:m.95406 g.95406  ORF g.95406 m.95406 type:complete len:87 (-) comp8946_c0_seq2:2103-2363(-)